MPGFGRIIATDPRDSLFPMRAMLDQMRDEFFPRGIPSGSRHYFSGAILDQGETGTCVAHGWTSKIHAAPLMQKMNLTPFDFYRRIVTIDEWTDNDFEANASDNLLQSGTSVRAGAKMLVQLGYAKQYLWAESAEDVRAWILAGFGGVVFGTWWKSNMMQTDTEGFVGYTGNNVGGHAYYGNGWNDRVPHNGQKVPAVRCQQSWGGAWGQRGRFWMTMEDLDLAIREGGEACALTEQAPVVR